MQIITRIRLARRAAPASTSASPAVLLLLLWYLVPTQFTPLTPPERGRPSRSGPWSPARPLSRRSKDVTVGRSAPSPRPTLLARGRSPPLRSSVFWVGSPPLIPCELFLFRSVLLDLGASVAVGVRPRSGNRGVRCARGATARGGRGARRAPRGDGGGVRAATRRGLAILRGGRRARGAGRARRGVRPRRGRGRLRRLERTVRAPSPPSRRACACGSQRHESRCRDARARSVHGCS